MAAAEMERRIGLMGRLNDAAARLRPQPQPEPEVADNDADLWYAACFACTTSLQVVRLFRRQRAELPQRDLMGEAYLVVLTQLVGDAEASRERLEDTAIPDIDDGLANARATLLAEAHAAMDEMAETVAADLREFNQDLPVEIRPAMRGLPAVTERAAALAPDPSTRLPNRLEDPPPVGPRASVAACCPDHLAHHHHGPPTHPWRGYRTLHSAISIGIKPPRLFPLPLIPCLPDMATSLRWIRA